MTSTAQVISQPISSITEEELLAMPEQDYMNDAQISFFRQLLLDERREVEQQLANLREQMSYREREADELDQALLEEENRHRLRMVDRNSQLISKIQKTLELINEGEYGYCRVSGEPIGLRRLLLRPTADLCAEEKARQESRESHFLRAR